MPKEFRLSYGIFWRFRRTVLRAFPKWLRLPPVLWPMFLFIAGLNAEEMIRGGRYLVATPIEYAAGGTLMVATFLYAIILFLASLRPPKEFEIDEQ